MALYGVPASIGIGIVVLLMVVMMAVVLYFALLGERQDHRAPREQTDEAEGEAA